MTDKIRIAPFLWFNGNGRWTVRRVPVADTHAWIDICGRADLIWLESPSNPRG